MPLPRHFSSPEPGGCANPEYTGVATISVATSFSGTINYPDGTTITYGGAISTTWTRSPEAARIGEGGTFSPMPPNMFMAQAVCCPGANCPRGIPTFIMGTPAEQDGAITIVTTPPVGDPTTDTITSGYSVFDAVCDWTPDEGDAFAGYNGFVALLCAANSTIDGNNLPWLGSIPLGDLVGEHSVAVFYSADLIGGEAGATGGITITSTISLEAPPP